MTTALRRITPEEVQAAYERTGLQPARGTFYRQNGSQSRRACGLGALLYAQTGLPPLTCVSDRIAAALHLDKDYSEGFILGFDGEPSYTHAGDSYRSGYADGLAAALLVFQPKGGSR